MNTLAENHYDVLIVGAGLVGAALGCAIGQRKGGAKRRIGVLEAGGEPATFQGADFDPRVVALSNASQRFLTAIGVWGSIAAARLCPYTDMQVWDGEGTGAIHFDCSEVNQPCLGYIVENSVVVSAIWQRLKHLENIEFLQPASVINLITADTELSKRNQSLGCDGPRSEVVVELNHRQQTLTTQLLIAADGANSPVRKLGKFKTREWDYGHKAIVTTVCCEKAHGFTARQRFMSTGPLAFLPLLTQQGDSHYCSIVWSIDSDRADEIMAMDDAAFTASLTNAFESRLGAVTAAAKRYCLPLRQRYAQDYVQPGIALVGDAAHTIHPLAGQGVNLGFLDAAVLSEEIGRALDRGIPPSDYSILRRYQRNRMAGNLGMMVTMEGFKRLFAAENLSLRWLRNTGMNCLDNISPLKNAVVKRAMGL